MSIQEKLTQFEKIVDKGISAEDLTYILQMLGSPFPIDIIQEIKIYCDYLPKIQEVSFSQEKRYLHFLWDILDKLPISVVCNFAIPFRQIIAKKLFKKCGKNFIADEDVRFNIAENIEIGDNVFITRGVYLDSKGGIEIGDSVAFGERVIIFTHTHSEDNHAERDYKKVVIKDYVKLYTNSTILPGVTIGEQAIVAAGSMVNKDVEANTLVGGIPAKLLRKRKTNIKKREELNHIWFLNGAFQRECHQ
ncbi:MAG: acyltransferase [Desulfobacterales bacterium]|nr:acyltransferase [Desulfobacterales bacterium]MBF0396851.1 acyltransferase [Desulfobacterales bacterium]